MYDFDEHIDQRGTHNSKWDDMEKIYGLSPDDALPMWVADMDFRPPQAVNDAVREAAIQGTHGYFGDDTDYLASISGWMQRRHNWTVAPDTIATTHGVVAGVGLCLRAYTEPGDGIILFTPVYHAFARMIHANDRLVHESPLTLRDGRYDLDLDTLAASLTGNEKMMIFCSPHNPGGRIWSPDELRAVAEFCRAHDLLLVCDEIHHDIIHPGHRHTPMPLAAPDCLDRLVMLSAASKVFNIAGGLTGNAIIPDQKLRARFNHAHRASGTSLNRLGVLMVTAAYSTGDDWVDALCAYLQENAAVFAAGIADIPGVRMTQMESTYLSWVDFTGTGMSQEEINDRLLKRARIAASDGPVFGTGGEGFIRFNIGTNRSRINEAVSRLQDAFSDLQ